MIPGEILNGLKEATDNFCDIDVKPTDNDLSFMEKLSPQPP